MSESVTTRFAPSPTGPLHLGHAYSALKAYDLAQRAGGRFLLRHEDIDQGRVRAEYYEQIEADLRWLGIAWDGPALRQSDRFSEYHAALERLKAQHLVYPCFCTRKDIAAEIAASASAPHGPDGLLYPGTCRHLDRGESEEQLAKEAHSWRIDMARAVTKAGPLFWQDHKEGRIEAVPKLHGDVVLARKDVPTSYHLAVTVDDAAQSVTDVVRGADLFSATHIHRLLQNLLDLPTPRYHHHILLTDERGKRLAKRDTAQSLATLRESEVSASELKEILRAESPDIAASPHSSDAR